MDENKNDDIVEISIADLFNVFKNHTWKIVICAVVALGLAVAYIMFLATPVYESKVSMMVSPLSSSGSSISSMLTGGITGGGSDNATEISLITSAKNIRNAAQLLDLSKYTNAEGVTYKELAEEKGFIDNLEKSVKVTSTANTKNVEISFKDANAEFAADYANALAESFRQYLATLAKDSKTSQRETLERQIPENEAQLQEAREALASYSAENGTTQIMSKIEVLNPQIALIQLQKEPLELEIQKNKDLVPSYFLVTAPKSDDVKALIEDYKALTVEYLLYTNLSNKAPETRTLSLTNEIGSKSQAIYSAVLDMSGSYEVAKPLADYLTGSAKYEVLSDLEQGYLDEIAGYQDTMIHLEELESNVAVYQQLVLSLKQMLEETKVIESSIDSNVTIVDAAEVGEAPVSPKKIKLSAIALFVGLFIGYINGFLIDILDTTVKSDAKVREILGDDVTSLGWTPYSKALPNDSNFYVLDDPDGYTAERYRILTSNIDLVIEKNMKVFSICSTDRSEGKSTATINTAANFAVLGKKVLVIDGDLRRPEMENSFRINRAKKGLSDVVLGKATKEEVILQPVDSMPTLHLLPAGAVMSNPNLIFNSAAFKDVINDLKKNYDLIFIDCPPFSFGSDFMLISHNIDAYILNVRAGATTTAALKEFKIQSKSIKAKLLGYIFYGRILTKNSGNYAYSSYSYDSNSKNSSVSKKANYRKIRKAELKMRDKKAKKQNYPIAPLAYPPVVIVDKPEKKVPERKTKKTEQ